jgi:hypothetical protein
MAGRYLLLATTINPAMSAEPTGDPAAYSQPQLIGVAAAAAIWVS